VLSKIKKDLFSSFLFQILNFLSSFFIGIYLIKHLSVNDFGIYSILLTVSSFINIILTLNIYEYLNISLKDNKIENNVLLSSILTVTVCVNIIFILIIIFSPIKEIILSSLNISFDNLNLLLLVLIFSVFYAIYNVLMRYLMFSGQVSLYNVSNYLYLYLWFIIVFLLGFTFNLKNIFLMKVIAIIMISFLLLLIYYYSEKITIKLKINFLIIKKALSFGMGTFIAAISFFIYGALDKYMLSNMLNNNEVAYYTFANTPFNILMTIVTNILVLIMLPYINKLHERNIDDKFGLYHMLIKYITIFVMPIFIFIIIFQDNIILILGKQEYLHVGKSFIYLSISFYLSLLIFLPKHELYLSNKLKVVSSIFLISVLLNICANYILIPMYKYEGAIIGTLIANVTLIILLLQKSKILILIGLYSDLTKMSILLFIVTFVLYFIRDFIEINTSFKTILSIISVFIITYIVYIIILFNIGIIKKSDIKIIV